MEIMAFSLYDSKAGVFQTPMFYITKATAIRAFGDLANDRQTTVFRHPEDFSLFYIGVFDDSTGVYKSVPHENLGTAASYKNVIVNGNQKGIQEVGIVNGELAEVVN